MSDPSDTGGSSRALADENAATFAGREPSEAPVPIGNSVAGDMTSADTRGSARREAPLNSPHQSSSRTCGHTPSIMNDFWLTGCSAGEVRRHWPHDTPRESEFPFCLS
jgi:hypothetical protein